ncbi:hypothetical protein [Acetobacterium wieringae]|uniref:hypothetical protein n=1 Tax=Acetobacterium wieringae TaxID=52694 RepID=UPI000877F5C7|nr:hypothetical protein [Acetobacterium wieringae]
MQKGAFFDRGVHFLVGYSTSYNNFVGNSANAIKEKSSRMQMLYDYLLRYLLQGTARRAATDRGVVETIQAIITEVLT